MPQVPQLQPLSPQPVEPPPAALARSQSSGSQSAGLQSAGLQSAGAKSAAVYMTRLAGWGANRYSESRYREPETSGQVRAWLRAASVEGVTSISRGLGRSYGDAATNGGGQVLGMTHLSRYLAFDDATGTLTCEAGVSLEQIIQHFTPRGWFPMITPGTKYVTVGGCIANDVHGKAHHAQGSFSTCVESMTILLANGEVVTASRTENPDLFWASFGGMGLLGIVLTATLQLRRIETTYFRQQAFRVRNLEEMLSVLDAQDQQFPYSVATLDVFAKGAALGRGVITVGDHVSLEQLPTPLRGDPLKGAPTRRLTLPFRLPEFTLNPLSMRVVNAAIQAIQSGARPFGHFEGFFYPLDMISHWNRGYGRRGFTQYQFVIPFQDGVRRMRDILTAIFSAGELPFLNVLKRMGKASASPLSFPAEGYTLAIDFPIRQNTAALCKRLDALVLEAGGRIYLGKDSFLDAATFHAMYPQAKGWLETKAKYDPHGVFTSDLARRVGLTLD
ncbi:MAG TPA: FAD-binding oxidoreductase [Polyangiaceae bacterium]|nr:FAD-binding oxidoreductase [Polyangiaceae bacterium]